MANSLSNMLEELINGRATGRRRQPKVLAMKDGIVLERIQVNRLFGRYNYDIDLKNGYNVAILIAPNGCGKTTIFNMIDIIFRPTLELFNKIVSIPFDSFVCTLSNGNRIGLSIKDATDRNEDRDDGMPPFPSGLGRGINKLDREGKDLFCTIEDCNGSYELGILDSISLSMELERAFGDDEGVLLDFSGRSDDDYEFPDEYRFKKSRVSKTLSSAMERAMRLFREEHDCNIYMHYITADRLFSNAFRVPNIKDTIVERRRGGTPLDAIQRRIRDIYLRTDDEYKRLVSDARDRLPKMYIEAKDTVPNNFDHFKKEWVKYLADINKLYELGLIDSNQNILEVEQLEKAYSEKGTFLEEYLKAFKPTLEPWKREYVKLKLFSDIFDKRNEITLKTLKYGPSGIVISVGGEEMPIEYLSSGEKNDLVMFYNLIFECDENCLVLIDEPEISLHIVWQEEFLDYLLEICKMNKLQAIISTHSPNIVNGHFELYPERGLQGEYSSTEDR